MATALIFPGQGSQRPGMGQPFVGSPDWELVAHASDRVGRDLRRLLLDADADELRRPREAQIATLLVSLLALAALRAEGVLDRLEVRAMAGHSLGEYTALVAAGALTEADGLALVAERGEAMQTAADAAPGTMAAVLGLDDAAIDAVCADLDSVWAANYNGPGHVVVSGTADGVAAASAAAKEAGARRVLPIPVGGAYHTPLMAPARPRLAAALAASAYADAGVPVTTNVDAAAHTSAGEWAGLLTEQLTAPVRWRQSLDALVTGGVDRLVEVGPGGVLTGLAKRGAPTCTAVSVATPDDVAALQAVLDG